jgi:hypothetical protein
MERLLDSEAWGGSVAAASLSSSAADASKPGPCDIEVERFDALEAAERPLSLEASEAVGNTKLLAAQMLAEEGVCLRPVDFVLKETSTYLGLYFSLEGGPARQRLAVHVTIAHWENPVVVQLSDEAKKRIVNRAISGLKDGRFRYALVPAVDLGRRVLLTFDVRGRQHETMYALAAMATQFLQKMGCRCTPSWRQNFHLSIDRVENL